MWLLVFLQDRQSLENAGSFRNFTLILNFTTETNWNNLFENKKRKKNITRLNHSSPVTTAVKNTGYYEGKENEQ